MSPGLAQSACWERVPRPHVPLTTERASPGRSVVGALGCGGATWAEVTARLASPQMWTLPTGPIPLGCRASCSREGASQSRTSSLPATPLPASPDWLVPHPLPPARWPPRSPTRDASGHPGGGVSNQSPSVWNRPCTGDGTPWAALGRRRPPLSLEVGAPFLTLPACT